VTPTTNPTSSGSLAPSTAGSGGTAPGGTAPGGTVPGGTVPTTAASLARPVAIPDAAAYRLIQLSDTPQSAVRETLSQEWRGALVTPPCATAAPASDTLVVERTTVGMAFELQGGPIVSTVWEMLTRYRPGGAAQYMSELTAALAACGAEDGITRTFAARSFAGDDSVLVLSTFISGLTMQTQQLHATYFAAIRSREVALLLSVQPVESGEIQRATMDRMIDIAIKRAER
jgi:hypothetical protein